MPIGAIGQKRPAVVIRNAVHIAQVARDEVEVTRPKRSTESKSRLAEPKLCGDKLTANERSAIMHNAARARCL